MKLTKAIEKEILKVLEVYWTSYLDGDIDTFSSVIDPEYKLIGTSEGEILNNREDTIKWLTAQIKEVEGKVEFRDKRTELHALNDLILTNEFANIFISVNDKWKFYSKIRISTILRKHETGWKIYQQHGSLPDSRTGKGETISFETLSRENLELKEAVKRRTTELEIKNRELEIEAALDRVRAKTMAMHKTEDLQAVVGELYEQMSLLKLANEGCNINIFKKDINAIESWLAGFDGISLPECYYMEGTGHPFLKKQWDKWGTQAAPFHISSTGKELEEYTKYILEETDLKRIPEDFKEMMMAIPALHFSYITFKYGQLEIVNSDKLPSQEQLLLLSRFAKVFEQTYTRFLDLKKAEAQAREAQIERALERVRSRTMAMQSSDELIEVANVIDVQTRSLGINLWSVSYNILSEDKRSCICFPSSEGQVQASFEIPFEGEKSFVEWMHAIERGDSFYVQELSGKDLEDHYAYLLTLPGIQDAVDPLEKAGISFPTSQVNHLSIFSKGFLLFITYEQVPEAHDIFKRFTQAFEQTYTRFLDLKKAEAQAREAKIEAALERTRTQSMMMQHSEELNKVSHVFHEQLLVLDLPSEFSYVWLPDEPNHTHMFWATWSEEVNGKLASKSKAITYPLDKSEPYTAACFEMWESDESVFVNPIAPEEVEDFFNTWSELLSGAENLKAELFPEGLYYAEAYMKYGCFGINIRRPLDQEEQQILNRFSIEFERAYTRFLDLKKAEAQAREKEIELGLERVRAKAMAMRNSNELAMLVNTVFNELSKLDFDVRWCLINIYDEASNLNTLWGATPDIDKSPEPIHMELGDWPFHQAFRKAHKERLAKFVYVMEGQEKEDYEEYMFSETEMKNIPPEAQAGIKAMERHVHTYSFSNFGGIQTVGEAPLPDDKLDILSRFGKVFDLTYTRFYDLKIAEEQTRQAKIETALERVRARAMAMQEPEELKEVAQVLRTEMGKLEIKELETCSIYIKDTGSSKAECWYAIKDIREDGTRLVKDQFHLDLEQTWVGRQMLSFYNGNDDRVSIVMKGDNRKEWMKYCEKHSEPLKGYYGDVIPERTYHLSKFSNGSIGFASAGDISEESWNILTRAATAFSLAYSRFQDLTRARNDLIQLKEEKKRAEDALSDLKEAQKQLIHAEKMASLGELTAGIAHEIQNPLNFVNNFSEVSSEMVEEVSEEIDKGDTEEAKEILSDLKGNLEKITHHGQRASGIVRSMLDHSRTTGGEKVETDINALCDEYLRLAYHGMRAKDRSFNAEFKTHLDPELPKIKVIPQDIGRVLLNLINNAFQAVNEDKNEAPQELKALKGLVSVTTKNLGDKVEITVSDNGPGIPDNIKDKIFQPFFTTKPTGQGTGLGLSLSYDIIKTHGGNLEVKSIPNEQTDFLITLPVKASGI